MMTEEQNKVTEEGKPATESVVLLFNAVVMVVTVLELAIDMLPTTPTQNTVLIFLVAVINAYLRLYHTAVPIKRS